MCWSCALRQQSRSPPLPTSRHLSGLRAKSSKSSYHSSSRLKERLELYPSSDPPVFNPALHSLNSAEPEETSRAGIREQLRKWHEEHGHETGIDPGEQHDVNEFGEASNNFTRLGDMDNLRRPEEVQQDERDDAARLTHAPLDEIEDYDPAHRFLRKGDLVVLDFPRSEREPMLAIFVRRVGQPLQSQFYTVHGKWLHATEKHVQHSVLSFMDSELIDPIIPYLPDSGITDELMDRAQMFDLSVPREVSAPLVSQMLEFQRKSDEVYRENATTLDNAHKILAHETDLKFGTLSLLASRLLGKDEHGKMPPERIYAVRKAIARGGFAFGHDRRSHRLTGFIQIRSKEQVANVEKVRNWLRQWQDELASFAAGTHKTNQFSPTSQGVVDFIHKARTLIQKSRELRDVTPHGRLGTSKKRFDVNKRNVLEYHHSLEFNSCDRELIKFFEGWACSSVFLGLPRVEALPPLLLQATGMYEELDLNVKTGFTFLQELGVLTPHENRVRFDSHLLLPSSQHSKPLEQLMTKVMSMGKKADFVDSMEYLRKDWGDLPVFCIDGEGAHEIDDGVSVEKVGNGEYWVHVHIANPTAFFDNHNALAKMARHMTETIYMPERAYVMLPRWATKNFFSLEKNRPCLTFSAKMNSEAEVLEHKVQSGIIRNVKFITPVEAARVIGVDAGLRPDVVLTVGGELPHRAPRKTAKSLSESEIDMLKIMQKLAEGRQAKRRSAGGLFLDTHRPELNIWQTSEQTGLGWEHPSRTVARHVEGDPVIEYRTKELLSWFSSGEGVSDILVRELMLLACEIGAKWCAERNIPVIYRGTIDTPHGGNATKFLNEVLKPAAEKNNGEAPMHLAIEYLRNTGSTVLTTKPLHHRVLGLGHYSKATSPLRRFGDMLLHWQVEAALREEAKSGQYRMDFSGTAASSLPYTEQNLNQMALGLQPRESMIRRATTYSEEFWLTSLFFRAHYYKECELPAKLTAYIHMQANSQLKAIPCLIKEYSAMATMMLPHDGLGSAQTGDSWEVTIEAVDVFNRIITVKPTRLLDRWEG